MQQLAIYNFFLHWKLNDLIFFIKSPSNYFNINDFIFCSFVSTRSSTGFKLQHISSSSNPSHSFYFCRLLRLWNSLPTIEISLSTTILKQRLQRFLWNHFLNNFEDDNSCTFHYYCPCTRYSHKPKQPTRTVL